MRKIKFSLMFKFLIPLYIILNLVITVGNVLIARTMKVTTVSTRNEITRILEQELRAFTAPFLSQAREIANVTALFLENTNQLTSYYKHSMWQSQHIGVSEIFFVSTTPVKYGGLTLSAVGWFPTSDYDQTTRDWYKKTIVSDEPLISVPYLTDLGTLASTVSARVVTASTDMGVLGMDISVDKMAELVAKYQDGSIIDRSYELSQVNMAYVEPSANVFIVDTNGLYITHTNNSKLLKDNVFEETILSNVKSDMLGKDALSGTFGRQYWYSSKKVQNTDFTIVSYGTFEESNKVLAQANVVTTLLMLVTLAAVSVLIRILVTPITRAIRETNIIATKISYGDFTAKFSDKLYNRKDDVGLLAASISKMRYMLRDVVVSINEASLEVDFISRQISEGSDELSVRTDAQASSLEETAASMEEMTSSIEHLMQSMDVANNIMTKTYKSVNDVAGVIADTALHTEAIYESSSKISSITKLIENIAFQTNILALNASVEAARAGENGRGFAVVASEVRSLAQSTANSVAEISGLIIDSDSKIQIATGDAQNSALVFREIQKQLSEAVKIINDMTNAAREQSNAVENVNKAVVTIDGITKKNVDLMSVLKMTSDASYKQAQKLIELMKFFRVNIEDDKEHREAR